MHILKLFCVEILNLSISAVAGNVIVYFFIHEKLELDLLESICLEKGEKLGINRSVDKINLAKQFKPLHPFWTYLFLVKSHLR